MKFFLKEFFIFGIKQARAALFGGIFLVLLSIAHPSSEFLGIARNDFLFISAVFVQIMLVLFGLETWREVRTITAFHVLGLGLELFKTHPSIGSWAYASGGFFNLGTVPLYSGFMYAAIGSYMSQAWHIFSLRLHNTPSVWVSVVLAIAIYGNFFTNHWVYDVRYILAALVCISYYHTFVTFTVSSRTYGMWLPLSFILIAFFVWIAENVGTFFGAWIYPHQARGWNVVSLHKISSWSLLVILSFLIVSLIKHSYDQRNRGRIKSSIG